MPSERYTIQQWNVVRIDEGETWKLSIPFEHVDTCELANEF